MSAFNQNYSQYESYPQSIKTKSWRWRTNTDSFNISITKEGLQKPQITPLTFCVNKYIKAAVKKIKIGKVNFNVCGANLNNNITIQNNG